MFSLLDLRFVLCSRDLDVRKGLWEFLILIPLKSTRSENPFTWNY